MSALVDAVPPAAPARPRRPRRPLLITLLVMLVLVGALGGLAGVQLSRPIPPATLTMAAPASVTVPGAPPGVPWPAQGQAGLMVAGLGSLGTSGGGASVPIGSVAKVMTAVVVLTDHPLDAGQPGPLITLTTADVADYHRRIPSGESVVAVSAGERLTEQQALQALLLPSANNIAQVLALWDAGGVDAFIAKMNATAASLGMSGTHYTDPSGLAPTTVSTPADQIVLAQRALRLPAFVEVVGLGTATLPVAGTVRNYNSLLGTDGVFGIKTGSTDEAGGNLVFAAHLTAGGQSVTVVGAVLNQPGKGTPEQLASANAATRTLLAAVVRTVALYEVVPEGPVGTISTVWGRKVTVRTAAPVQVLGWPGLTLPVEVHTVAPGRQVAAGQRLGTLTVHGGTADATVDIRAAGRIVGPTLQWRLTRRP